MNILPHHQRIIYRVSLIALFLLSYRQGACQIDLKNSLFDLKSELRVADNDRERMRLALTIGSFFLTNKERSQSYTDSAAKYAHLAEAINSNAHDKASADLVTILKAKICLRNENPKEVEKLIRQSSGALYCQLHALTGNYFLEKPGEEKKDLEIANKHFLTAQQYARVHGMPSIELVNMVYRYNVMAEGAIDVKVCDTLMTRILHLCRVYKLPSIELFALKAKAIDHIYYRRDVSAMYDAANTAHNAHDIPTENFCRKEIADYYLRHGKLDSTEMQLKRVLATYKSIGCQNVQLVYELLIATTLARGNLDQAMRYSLTAVKISESTGTDIVLKNFYIRLINICEDLGLERQSQMWYRKWRNSTLRNRATIPP